MNPDLEFNYKEYFRNAHFKRQKVYFEVDEWAGHFMTQPGSHKNLHIVKRIHPPELVTEHIITTYFVENLTDTGIELVATSKNLKIIELTFNYEDITIL